MGHRICTNGVCTEMELIMSGFQSKRMITTHGRGMGKSVWANMIRELTMPDVKVLDSADVDGKTWYTVQLSMPAREWLREQPTEDWHEHIDQRYYVNQSMFDISEQMYSALTLKWS